MDRREFLKVAGVTGLAASMPAPLLFAKGGKKDGDGTRPTLIVIYLRGGMDAINAVVPHGDPHYYDIRPTIAIPDESADDGGIIELDNMFGLHHSLRSLKPWWDEKKFAIVMNAGSPHPTRSHFDAQDFMEYAAPGIRTMRDGWLNRYLALTSEDAKDVQTSEDQIRALAMQGLLPRALRGEVPVLAVPEKKVMQQEKVLDAFRDLYGCNEMMEKRRDDDPVVETAQDTLETLEVYKRLIGDKDRKANYPDSRLGKKLKDIASVIHAGAGLEVACVDVTGWDHHANEGGGYGTIANMLKDLADSINAFANDLGKERMESTMIMTMTEFGRTCKENGNNGTDHGHGGCMFLLGGEVKGGEVHGNWLGLGEKQLYKERDLPVTTDFRDVFATVLNDHMQFEPPKDFFPEYRAKPVKSLF